MHEQKITADLSGMPGGGGDPRPVEKIALRQFSQQEEKEFDAVRLAIERTKRMPNAKDRLQIVKLTLWRNTYRLAGAANVLHISERTARRYRYHFILMVGLTYGFLTEEEYVDVVKKEYGNKITDSNGA